MSEIGKMLIRCTRCGQLAALQDIYENWDGTQIWCPDCIDAAVRAHEREQDAELEREGA